MIIYIFILLLLLYFVYGYITSSNIHKIYGKIAKTPEELEKGLMYRKHKLDKYEGMLFPMEKQINSMWMKNTYIPLDIIFLDETKKIIGYVIDTEPLSEKPLKIDKPSTYVLEMNGNSVFELDMKIGDIIYFVEEIDKN
jgi:uncharacterized membrane protein (UPF0127 family)